MFRKMISVLVTGCNGSLGSEITRILISQGKYRIVGIDLNEKSSISSPNFHYISLDLANSKLVSQKLEYFDFNIIFHTAAILDTSFFRTKTSENVAMTKNLLNHLVSKNPKLQTTFVYTSTHNISFEEDFFYTSPYTKSKLACENLVLELNSPSIATISLRPGIILSQKDKQFERIKTAAKYHLRLGPSNKVIWDEVEINELAAMHIHTATILYEQKDAWQYLGGKYYHVGYQTKAFQGWNNMLEKQKLGTLIYQIPDTLWLIFGIICEFLVLLFGNSLKNHFYFVSFADSLKLVYSHQKINNREFLDRLNWDKGKLSLFITPPV